MITPPNRWEDHYDENGKPTRRLSEFFEAIAALDGTDTDTIIQIIQQEISTIEPAETVYSWY